MEAAVPLTEEDQAFLFQLRKACNEDVHGGIAAVSRAGVERGAVILEKAIAAVAIFCSEELVYPILGKVASVFR